jgi:hypothetical protein
MLDMLWLFATEYGLVSWYGYVFLYIFRFLLYPH